MGMDLTEAEDIKKRWQEHTEELYKKDLHDPDNHDDVITHLEPDILECKVKWAFSSVQFSLSVVSDSLRPMDCSPQSSSVHGILQARILEWIAISFFFSGLLGPFKYSSSVYPCHLFLISSARSIPFLSFIEPIFA